MSDVFAVLDQLTALQNEGRPYHEFLQRESLSVGVYHLDPDQPDLQRPHGEDEIYYILGGTGTIEIAGEATAVAPGSVIYVARHVEHRFRDYPEGLTLLVIFAPARGSLATER